MTVALVHEQDIIYFILNMKGVQRDGLVQGKRVVSHIGVGQGLLCSQTIHGIKGEDLLQKIQGFRKEKSDVFK